MYTRLRVKYPLFLSYLNKTWIFYTYFRKILKYQISSKSLQLFHADGQTDMSKLTVAFRNCAYAPEACFLMVQSTVLTHCVVDGAVLFSFVNKFKLISLQHACVRLANLHYTRRYVSDVYPHASSLPSNQKLSKMLPRPPHSQLTL